MRPTSTRSRPTAGPSCSPRGRMDIAHADIGHLGFGTGTSSGVAWRGTDHAPGVSGTKAVGS